MKSEFDDFLNSETVIPPRAISERVISKVMRDLNPTGVQVFVKIALIHLIVGSISLVACPQFGLSPLGNMGLMAYLMKYSQTICMVGCGAIFIGGTALASSLFLRPEEVRVLRKKEALQFAVLGILSLGAFICMGASVVISLAMAWLLGSWLGGFLSLEIGWSLRKKLIWDN